MKQDEINKKNEQIKKLTEKINALNLKLNELTQKGEDKIAQILLSKIDVLAEQKKGLEEEISPKVIAPIVETKKGKKKRSSSTFKTVKK